MDVIPLLKQLPFFADLPDDLLGQVVSTGQTRMLSAGEIVFRQGDPPDGLYVLLDGKVRVFLTDEQRAFHASAGDLGSRIFPGSTVSARAEFASESRTTRTWGMKERTTCIIFSMDPNTSAPKPASNWQGGATVMYFSGDPDKGDRGRRKMKFDADHFG